MKIIKEEMFLKEENDIIRMNSLEKTRIRNWVNYEGEYYYIKDARLQNEIIGAFLAQKLNLKTAHYEPVKYYDLILYASKNFKDKDKEYFYLYDLFKLSSDNKIEKIKENCKDYNRIKKQILKMYAIDIFMRQLDRCYINFMFEKSNDLELAPLFDYSNSFMNTMEDYHTYNNPLLSIKTKELKKTYDKYPELEDYLNRILNINILQFLYEFNKIYNINIKYDYYEKEFELSKKMIKGR